MTKIEIFGKFCFIWTTGDTNISKNLDTTNVTREANVYT